MWATARTRREGKKRVWPPPSEARAGDGPEEACLTHHTRGVQEGGEATPLSHSASRAVRRSDLSAALRCGACLLACLLAHLLPYLPTYLPAGL